MHGGQLTQHECNHPDVGLICGGKLSIYVEPIVEPKLYLFGGGHVSGAILDLARVITVVARLIERRRLGPGNPGAGAAGDLAS